MTIQEEIAAVLVARGWAMRKSLREHKCRRSIELKAINDGCGHLYVDEFGRIWAGQTRAKARRIGGRLRSQMLGEK